jgi:hypothetical protein
MRLHREFVKFKSGQVQQGMNGSPLLNLRTGGVCGISIMAHPGDNGDGGIGLSTKGIFECLPDLKKRQQQYHQNNVEWSESLRWTPLRK